MGLVRRDHHRLTQAVTLAEQALFTTDPNPRVGCVIYRDEVMVGEGLHWQAGCPHAEVNALAQAGDRARGATVYVTLEPCSHFGRTPPCADALIHAGVARVVVGMVDPNPRVSGEGIRRLRAAGICVDVLPETAPLQMALKALNPGFLQRMRLGRPFVRVKLAASMDGRTALANGESQWITGPEARADVHALRARSSAIVTGVDTVLMDNASLTVRPEEHVLHYPKVNEVFPFSDCVRQPLRVVLDSRFRLPATHSMCQQRGQTVIVGCSNVASDDALPFFRHDACTVETLALHQNLRVHLSETSRPEVRRPSAFSPKVYSSKEPFPTALKMQTSVHAQVSVQELVSWLGLLGLNEIMVEAGSRLASAFVMAGVVDELWLYQAPMFLGAEARPLLDVHVDTLVSAPRWQCESVSLLGKDVRLVLKPSD